MDVAVPTLNWLTGYVGDKAALGRLAFRIITLCSRGTHCKEALPRGSLTLASALSLCALRTPRPKPAPQSPL